ncbi:signal recognition particle protein [Candidatus Woesearchaeota archaeon]|nr:signal recognition particle protein [Candidatus Woesearchaeota archaeon]
MVLDRLSSSLKDSLKKIKSALFLDKALVQEIIKDIQRALLQSDVDVSLVMELTKKIKERALEEKAPSGLDKKEYLIKIIYEELVGFVGEGSKIEISKKPVKIMLVGLFGNGKTTTAAKIAKHFKKRGKKVALLQTDTYRPAAYDQLKQLSDKIKVDFFGNEKQKNAIKVYNEFSKKLNDYDLVIIDTAGRDALNKELIKELTNLNRIIKPDKNLLVMGADIGQAARKQAEKFHETCKVNGVIITKLDGTAKGGGALAACAATKSPIVFIGVGEKVDDIEEFRPEGFISQLLGMGDIEALLEKAKHSIDEEKAVDISQRFMKGDFNLVDLYEQMNAMKKMGPLKKIMKMVPGFSGMDLPDNVLDVQEENLEKWKFAMDSMTEEELENPDLISGQRVKRIAEGSGLDIKDVRSLIKQYRQSKNIMKKMKGLGKGKNINKLMKQFQSGNFKMKK